MLSRYFGVFACLFLLLVATSHSVQAFSGAGAGTGGNPYQIRTCDQLMEMANSLSSSYVLSTDIDCSGTSESPIGDDATPFTGSLNGQNFRIINFVYSTASTGQDVGLFGRTNGATISNVRMDGGSLSAPNGANNGVGSIVGTTDSGTTAVTTITHVSSTMTITGSSTGGGLIGGAFSPFVISKSSYSGSITGNDGYAGGLVGWILTSAGSNTVSDSYSQGTLTSAGSSYVGGIIGYMNSRTTIARSYAAHTVTMTGSTSYAGGIAGYMDGTVTDSFAASSLSGSATYKGALFGYVTTANNVRNVYFDNTIAALACSGNGSGTCSAISNLPNYFKNNTTNPPLNSWNFVDLWYTSSGSYPLLYGFTVFVGPAGSENHSSLAVSTTEAPHCSDARPDSAPDLFQVDGKSASAVLHFAPPAGSVSSYFISYGLSPGAEQYGVEWSQSKPDGAITFPINALSPQTTYYFRVRGGNGCMPGEWSQEHSVTTL